MSAADTEYPERERIAKSFTLASGSRIEISHIAGSVEIDTTSGRTADVEFVRAAPTRRELDCGAAVIEQAGPTLRIRSENRCQTIRSSHVVKLSVPRDVNLSLRNIAGHVRIGATDGMVRLESIAGHVEAAGLRHARMLSLAQGLALTVSDLSALGISVISVMGAIVTARLGGSATGSGVAPEALASALHPIFLLAIGLAGVALAAVLFVPHIELRQTMDETARSPELLKEAA